MITQTINLNLIPGAVPPRVNVTQYDEGSRTIVANLYNGTSSFTPSAGTTAKVKGTKPDKHGFEYDATISGRTVEIDLTQQMSCVAGDVLCEVELTLNDEVLGTGTFVLRVKASALADDTDISETEIPAIVDAARSSAASAAESAEAAQEAANSVSVEYTATGNPISVSAFPTEATTSMTIAPTQNLHGYDKPWAGGAGRNKAKVSSTLAEITVNGITFTPQTDGSIVVNGKCNNSTAALIYTNYNYGTGYGATLEDQFAIREKVLPNGSYVANATDSNGYISMQISTYNSSSDAGRAYNGASGGSFTIDDTFAYNNIRFLLTAPVDFEYNNYVIYPMIRLATEADATFEPYTNICPIIGISTATVQTTDGETTNTASMELGETVYAGSVNFNAGSGTVTKKSVTFDGSEDEEIAILTNPLRISVTCPNDSITMSGSPTKLNGFVSNLFKEITDEQGRGGTVGFHLRNDGNHRIVLCLGADSGIDTVAKARTWLSNNPTQVVYTLATPETLSLTSDTLTMLAGEQTVSGNGETVTLTYDGNVKQYIDTKVPDAPTTDGTYTLTCVVSGGVPTYSWT